MDVILNLQQASAARSPYFRVFVFLGCCFLSTQVTSAFDWLGMNQSSVDPDSLTNFQKLDSFQHRTKPILGIEVGGMTLQRSFDSNFPLVETDGTSGPVTTVATSEVLDPEAEIGTRWAAKFYNLTRYVPGLDMEVSRFNVDGTTAQLEFNADNYPSTNMMPYFFGGQPATPVPSYTIFVESKFDSTEWMAGYRPIPRVRLLAGVRWLSLQERFDVLETAELPTRDGFYSEAQNDASGWQVGVEATLWNGRYLRVFGKVKYADLDNEVRGNAIAQNIQFEYSGEVDTTLVDYEIGISAPIGDWAALRFAYQGLRLDDAVGAVEQSGSQLILDPTQQNPVYHELEWDGFQFGVEFLW